MALTKKLTALLATRAELDANLSNKLRKSILQEAIRGKLVEQNPNDEPASVLLERIREEKARLVKDGKIKMDELLIDPARRYVTVDGKAVNLAPKEYDLLMCFLDNREIVMSRERILDIVWGMDYDGYDRAVDTHIKKLRKALGKASYHIETVIKSGYVWK